MRWHWITSIERFCLLDVSSVHDLCSTVHSQSHLVIVRIFHLRCYFFSLFNMASFHSESAIVAAYKSRLVSDFDPPSPSSDILLTRRNANNSYGCGHVLYKSPDQFIDHILWFLHPKSLHLPYEMKMKHSYYLCFQSILNMCSHCVNIMLCKVHLLDIINLYSISCREHILNGSMIDCYAETVRDLLRRIMCHPKMHRIIISACSLSKEDYILGERRHSIRLPLRPPGFTYVHDWDYLCEFIVGELSRCKVGNHPATPFLMEKWNDEEIRINAQNQYHRKMVFLRTLWLSFKYWSEYQMLFFIHYYLCRMNILWTELMDKTECEPGGIVTEEENPYFGNLVTLLSAFLEMICKNAMRMGMAKLKDQEIVDTICKFADQNFECTDSNGNSVRLYETELQYQRQHKTHLKNIAVCGWTKCGKEGIQIDGDLKVCKQCRMEYYCSRRCQKKAWKYEHRTRCKTLQTFYSLDLLVYCH